MVVACEKDLFEVGPVSVGPDEVVVAVVAASQWEGSSNFVGVAGRAQARGGRQ